jgi:hypothetical protein
MDCKSFNIIKFGKYREWLFIVNIKLIDNGKF